MIGFLYSKKDLYLTESRSCKPFVFLPIKSFPQRGREISRVSLSLAVTDEGSYFSGRKPRGYIVSAKNNLHVSAMRMFLARDNLPFQTPATKLPCQQIRRKKREHQRTS